METLKYSKATLDKPKEGKNLKATDRLRKVWSVWAGRARRGFIRGSSAVLGGKRGRVWGLVFPLLTFPGALLHPRLSTGAHPASRSPDLWGHQLRKEGAEAQDYGKHEASALIQVWMGVVGSIYLKQSSLFRPKSSLIRRRWPTVFPLMGSPDRTQIVPSVRNTIAHHILKEMWVLFLVEATAPSCGNTYFSAQASSFASP